MVQPETCTNVMMKDVAFIKAGTVVFCMMVLLQVPLLPNMTTMMPAHAITDEQDEALRAARRGEIMPYALVRAIAERKLRAKVVGERLRRTNRGWVYEFRARDKKGRVIFAVFSATDGRMIARK